MWGTCMSGMEKRENVRGGRECGVSKWEGVNVEEREREKVCSGRE